VLMESFKIDKRDVTFHGAGPRANLKARCRAGNRLGIARPLACTEPLRSLEVLPEIAVRLAFRIGSDRDQGNPGPSDEGRVVVFPNIGAFFPNPGSPEAIGETGDPQNWRLRGGPKHGTLSLT